MAINWIWFDLIWFKKYPQCSMYGLDKQSLIRVLEKSSVIWGDFNLSTNKHGIFDSLFQIKFCLVKTVCRPYNAIQIRLCQIRLQYLSVKCIFKMSIRQSQVWRVLLRTSPVWFTHTVMACVLFCSAGANSFFNFWMGHGFETTHQHKKVVLNLCLPCC